MPDTHLVGTIQTVPQELHSISTNPCFSVFPWESAAFPVPWGVCFRACEILEDTKMWSLNKIWSREPSLGKCNNTLWRILVQKATYFENHLLGQLSRAEELWWQLCFQSNQQSRSTGETQMKNNNSRQRSIQTA